MTNPIEELLVSTKAYAKIQLDLRLEWDDPGKDSWIPVRVFCDDEDAGSTRLRGAGTFNGRSMIEVEHDRYGEPIIVYVEACDAVLASLLYG